jgi:RHS repeat-associated protein
VAVQKALPYNVIASTLYAPYGTARYSSGAMPTDRGFTGQVADSTSGLDYYGARYYDPVGGQFASPDSLIQGGGFDFAGLSAYAYVEGNPSSYIDPSGNVGGSIGACGARCVVGNAINSPSLLGMTAAVGVGSRSISPLVGGYSNRGTSGPILWMPPCWQQANIGPGCQPLLQGNVNPDWVLETCGLDMACAEAAIQYASDWWNAWINHTDPRYQDPELSNPDIPIDVLPFAPSTKAPGSGSPGSVEKPGPLQGATYSPKVSGQMTNPNDPFHAFPTSVDQSATWGHAATVEGGSLDGQPYLHVNVPGDDPLGNA